MTGMDRRAPGARMDADREGREPRQNTRPPMQWVRFGHRGYCGIGIENAKSEVNLGTLWRSSFCLGADFIFTIGDRYKKQASDTTCAWRHIPYWRFETAADFRQHIPYDCQLVGVEVSNDAIRLPLFVHPQRAIYLLGPEDGSLSEESLALCGAVVRIPSIFCLNVAVAGAIVLYDRYRKTEQP